MRPLAALALLTMTAFCTPSEATEHNQLVPFHLGVDSSPEWIATVPARGPVWVEVVFTQGAALTEVTMDGPGACAGTSLGAPMATPMTPATSTKVECGSLWPQTVGLSLGLLAGEVSGYLVLHGMTAQDAS